MGHKKYTTLQPTSAPPSGFSLLEMMIVLATTLILDGTAALTVSTHRRRNILKAEMTAVQLFLEEIYAHALAYQQDLTLSLSPFQMATSQTLGAQRSRYLFRHGVTLALAPTQSKTLQFNSTISATPTTLIFQYHDLRCNLVISLRGRIRLSC